MAKSGACITATNPAAEKHGLTVGMSVADARAMLPALAVEAADPAGDDTALRRLALWCQRYSPLTRSDEDHGLCLDITGCAHLFGGEAALACDLADRLHGFGLTARIALTPTIGAGWALARYGSEPIIETSIKDMREQLSALPVGGLRLPEETVIALNKVGLTSIGMLIGKPRAPLATRFGRCLVERLDQALGHIDEALDPIEPPPVYRSLCRFTEPIITLPAVETATRRLTRDLTRTLFRAGKGARRLELAFYRVDGWRETLDLRTSALSRDASHLSRLLCERLDQMQDKAGVGFEAASLAAFDVESCGAVQHDFPQSGSKETAETDIAQLIDRLINRFGAYNVTRFVPQASYHPERSSRTMPIMHGEGRQDWWHHHATLCGDTAFARPLFLFPRPEPVTVMVETPDKPPAVFHWRNRRHRITRANGPERIAPEWWRYTKQIHRTRDYYRVEDEHGRRFWLYRDGLFERENEEPDWFIHGMFA